MKLQEIYFRRPAKVFQVFKNINVYGKASKSYEDRKEQLQWKTVLSKSGYVDGSELYLPSSVLEHPDLKTCDMITLEDDMQPQFFDAANLARTKAMSFGYWLETNRFLYTTRPNQFDIFEIRALGESVEINLIPGYFSVGIPERSSFKLCEVHKGKAVEIKINGKTDHSMTRGRARVYREQHYIFHYIGDFKSCKILRDPFEGVDKSVPEDRKVVDLLKPLW